MCVCPLALVRCGKVSCNQKGMSEFTIDYIVYTYLSLFLSSCFPNPAEFYLWLATIVKECRKETKLLKCSVQKITRTFLKQNMKF